jgi:hypothetical protein
MWYIVNSYPKQLFETAQGEQKMDMYTRIFLMLGAMSSTVAPAATSELLQEVGEALRDASPIVSDDGGILFYDEAHSTDTQIGYAKVFAHPDIVSVDFDGGLEGERLNYTFTVTVGHEDEVPEKFVLGEPRPYSLAPNGQPHTITWRVATN